MPLPVNDRFKLECNNSRSKPLTKKTGKMKTLKDALNDFESLKAKTTNPSEIRVYDRFIYLLSALKAREFSHVEMQSIEAELDRLNLESNPDNRKRRLKKALNQFEKYLKDTFSLTPKGYYLRMGISAGAAFGVVAGILLGGHFERSLGISFGVAFGLLVGLMVGRYMDAQAKTDGKML
jgi:F0F1-type ATP synthase assembly protein I